VGVQPWLTVNVIDKLGWLGHIVCIEAKEQKRTLLAAQAVVGQLGLDE